MSVSTSRSDDEAVRIPTKTRRACDSCYKRKIKCDAALPSCNWCQHHDIPCTFTRKVRRPKKQKIQHFHQPLNERVERIERLLIERFPQRDQEYPLSHVVTKSPAILPQHQPQPPPGQFPHALRPYFGKLHFAGLRLGDITSINGIPLFSSEGVEWVVSRTGEEVNFERLCPFSGLPWQSNQPYYLSTSCRDITLPGTAGLPDVKLVREYVAIFSSSYVRHIFPFIDPVLFEDTIRLAYEPTSAYQTGHMSSKSCVCAFLAVAGLFNLQDKTGPVLDSETFAWKTLSMLPLLSLETTLDGLQTCIMMLVFHLLSGNLQPGVFLNSYTSGLVFLLGAHTRNPNHRPRLCPEIQRRMDFQLRNIFWLSYTLDKELSLRTGQPPAINDDHCDLSLPTGYGEHLKRKISTYNLPSDSPIDFPLMGDLRLSRIKSKAYNMLYSIGALQKSDAELLRSIRELDSELETWRASLPHRCRPTMTFSKGSPISDVDVDMRSVMLRLEYHHCMAIIHQASGRCAAWTEHHNGAMEGVSSSLALSVEASRSSLSYLQTAQHVLHSNSFWLVLFYPMSAVLTLFCNLLQNPLDSEAISDLDLLSSVPALIRSLPIRQLTVNEVMHIKHVDDFVAELSRLARCAVVRASDTVRSQRVSPLSANPV